MPIVTVGAIVYARKQVKDAKANSRAMLLLSFEEKWNSVKMREARKWYVEKLSAIECDVHKTFSNLNDSEIERQKGDKFFALMKDLRENEQFGAYANLMEIINFFELLGLLVKKNYVPLVDVYDLFGGPILHVGVYFVPHIQERRKERGVPSGLYANALYLVSEIRKIHPLN